MIPKLKAQELIKKMGDEAERFYTWEVKACAIIAVDEMIIQNGELYLNGLDGNYYREKNTFLFEVKQEIENL
jgi:hypothetical protein